MNYTKNFIPMYGSGWQSLPNTVTPITSNALNKYDNALQYIENYLNAGNFLSQEEMNQIYVVNKYLDQVSTLSTSSPTTYSFEDNSITLNSTIDVYTNISGMHPSNMEIDTGICNVTYPQQDTEVNMACRIYIK